MTPDRFIYVQRNARCYSLNTRVLFLSALRAAAWRLGPRRYPREEMLYEQINARAVRVVGTHSSILNKAKWRISHTEYGTKDYFLNDFDGEVTW